MVIQVHRPLGSCWQGLAQSHLIRLPGGTPTSGYPFEALADPGSATSAAGRAARIFELPHLRDLAPFATRKGPWTPLRLLVDDAQLGELHRSRALLSRLRPTLVLCRCETSLARSVQFLASLQLPVEVTPGVWTRQDADAMRDLAERLLFSPFIKTPVQPFFDLLRACLSPAGAPTLWELGRERLGRYLYLSDAGQVTLSERWAKRQCYFGQVADRPQAWHTSDLYRSLRRWQSGGFRLDTRCAVCRVQPLCAGYLRADRPRSSGSLLACKAFTEFIAVLRTHANGLNETYRRLDHHHRGDLETNFRRKVPAKPGPTTGQQERAREHTTAIVLIPAPCQNACIFCAPSQKRALGATLSDAAIETFIERCGARGVSTLIFSGEGEPTHHPRLPEFIAAAAAAGIQERIITTNGTALSPDLLSRLKSAGTVGIVFSMHGIGATHDQIVRREGSFERLSASLQHARDLGVDIGLNACLVRANLSQIEDLLELGRRVATMPQTLSFPEWSGSALAHTALLATYGEIKAALDRINWAGYPRAALDNLPPCQSPAGIRPVDRPSQLAHLDAQGAKQVATGLNFGNNRIPDRCQRRKCVARDLCCGVDRHYLQLRGASEFHPRQFSAKGLSHLPRRQRGGPTDAPDDVQTAAACDGPPRQPVGGEQ
ncbi:MAG: radical SAM protein [Desulfosarcinaceae bacterium]|nr:radical SAM protein [Desulfosarcinaceae bacterium]